MIGQGLVVFFALCAAVCMAIGIVVRQRATLDVPQDQGVSSVMVSTLLRRPLWWAGTGVAVLGYVFQALALIKGSLILVQPLLVSALLFALPLSAWAAGRRVTRSELLWALLLTVGLAVFVLLAHPGPAEHAASLQTSTIVAAIVGAVIVGAVLIAIRVDGWRRAVLFSVAVGVLFGVVAVVTKINMHLLGERGLLGLLAGCDIPNQCHQLGPVRTQNLRDGHFNGDSHPILAADGELIMVLRRLSLLALG